jgi:hypothetical protein
VLASWTASPARYREDANAEEDLVLGGYRDRVLIELAQNAADAAARAGTRGRLRFTLDGSTLLAANTGAPIDAAGVGSASTLRASSKRDHAIDPVGRFGVGFAAVLAVCDEPTIRSRSGSVEWSRARTIAAVTAIPELHDEVARRGNAVPVLRLPYAVESATSPAAGFDTEVVLPLRDEAAVVGVRQLLGSVDAVALLTLRWLAEIEVVVDDVSRVLTAELIDDGLLIDGVRWIVRDSQVRLDAELLRDRPVEERGRRDVAITWALPVDAAEAPVPLPSSVRPVVHAPTPTDEPLTLPALLIAPLPLDPTRRHVAAGALRDTVLDHAAATYADLIRSLPSTPALLDLVPVAVAAGAIDGELRTRIVALLREVSFIATADAEISQRSEHAVLLDDAGLASHETLGSVLGTVLPELVPASWSRRNPVALAVLGVRRVSIAALIDELAGVTQPPAWWHELYDALATAGVSSEALTGLPVPLSSGAMALSARGLLMPGPLGDLDVLGLRTIDAEAAHPLLLRLGAVDADPRQVLADDRVRAAVENSYDADDAEALAEAVLRLVAAAHLTAGDEPWLAELALLADDGEYVPAGELLMPQGPLAQIVVDDAPFGYVDAGLIERWGSPVMTAVGVLETFGVVRANDVIDAVHDLDGEDDYLDELRAVLAVDEPTVVSEFVAVRDLEFVRADAWAAALAMLSTPPLRAAVVDQAVILGGSMRARMPSYTTWWLRRHRVIDGRLASSDPLLVGLFDVVTVDGDDEFLAAAGALREVDDADHDELARRLGDPDRVVDRAQVKALYARIAPRDPVMAVRAVRRGELVVVDAADAVIVDAPDLLPLLGNLAIVPVALGDASRVADALDISLASERASFDVLSNGVAHGDHVLHEELSVRDVDGQAQHVSWRLVDGTLHVDAGALDFGLGRGRAWRDGQWLRRYVETELLRGVVSPSVLLAESDLD